MGRPAFVFWYYFHHMLTSECVIYLIGIFYKILTVVFTVQNICRALNFFSYTFQGKVFEFFTSFGHIFSTYDMLHDFCQWMIVWTVFPNIVIRPNCTENHTNFEAWLKCSTSSSHISTHRNRSDTYT